MPNTKIKASHIIAQGVKIGDHLEKNAGDDIKALKEAIAAYGLASKTALAQVQYKKLTGTPGTVDFFED